MKKGAITINLSLQREAEVYASKSKAYTSDRHDFHEGGLGAKRRKMFEGKLGEKVVKHFFDNNDIFYVEDNSSHKEADNFDFIVFLKKNNQQIKVDVKTRTENFHTRTLEMLEQFNKRPKDVYISIRLYRSVPYTADIIGYCTRKDFLQINRVENNGYLYNYVLFDHELKDINRLKSHLKKNEK